MAIAEAVGKCTEAISLVVSLAGLVVLVLVGG